MPRRIINSLEGKRTKVSKDLCNLIKLHTIKDFVLIVIPISNIENKVSLQKIEQFWMLLNPTLNRSLSAISNNQQLMSINKRKRMRNIIYIYEIIDRILNIKTYQIIYGMKELARLGIKDSNNIIWNISYNDVKGCLSSLIPYKNKFILSLTPLRESYEINRKINTIKKNKLIWVYDSNTKELLTTESRVKFCLVKYNISKTHFNHIRKYKIAYNGKIFRNVKL